ncbi:hypothetical protein [Paraburkholderia oxyphila]|uniref:hypothetical protein n=1 Tax=Paraburkholderia oxyphila TaxID=614212 RepID=UPI0012ED6753|nr:hypothetical protein [Paraburkholderia oxyphila]
MSAASRPRPIRAVALHAVRAGAHGQWIDVYGGSFARDVMFVVAPDFVAFAVASHCRTLRLKRSVSSFGQGGKPVHSRSACRKAGCQGRCSTEAKSKPQQMMSIQRRILADFTVESLQSVSSVEFKFQFCNAIPLRGAHARA